MTPLRLTDEQLNQVMRTAAPLPPELRDEYLQCIADQLRGREIDDVHAKAAMWNVDATRTSARRQRRGSTRAITGCVPPPPGGVARSIRWWRNGLIGGGRCLSSQIAFAALFPRGKLPDLHLELGASKSAATTSLVTDLWQGRTSANPFSGALSGAPLIFCRWPGDRPFRFAPAFLTLAVGNLQQRPREANHSRRAVRISSSTAIKSPPPAAEGRRLCVDFVCVRQSSGTRADALQCPAPCRVSCRADFFARAVSR